MMNRNEYTSLAPRLDWLGLDSVDGTLKAGKSNGATYLDLGGDCEVTVKHRNGDDALVIDFEAEDSTKGTLTIPADAVPDTVGE